MVRIFGGRGVQGKVNKGEEIYTVRIIGVRGGRVRGLVKADFANIHPTK